MSAKRKEVPGAVQRPEYIEPSNPLACQNQVDTMHNVNTVLGFISSAIVAMQEQEASEYDIGDRTGEGLFLLLSCCQSALGAHLVNEGGAA